MKGKKLLITSLFLLLIVGTINLVHAGISVMVIAVNPNVFNQGDTATYTVSVESITTEDENMQLTIIYDNNLQPNWTFTEGVIGTGAMETFGLEIAYTTTSSGNFQFNVTGEAWPTTYNYSQAIDLGLLERSSYTAYVYGPIEPSPTPAIPEFPSLLVFSTFLFISLGMSLIFKTTDRKRKSWKITSSTSKKSLGTDSTH